MVNKSDVVLVGQWMVIKVNGMGFNIFCLSFGNLIGGMYFMVIMILMYRDGVLNFW